MANMAWVRSEKLWKPASTLHSLREIPKFLPLEVPGLKKLLENGLSRGVIVEISGGRSSGRTSLCLHLLAQATRRGEVCAVVDLCDSFHPTSAAATGAELARLLWVRCHRNAEHAMHAADLLLHAGGFGVVLLDICEASQRVLNRIPLSYWYRFHRAIENTPTILVVCAGTSQVKSSSTSKLHLQRKAVHWSGNAPCLVLRGIEGEVKLHKNSASCAERLWIQTVA
jgi:recA bacterial DNA recombination protein